MDFNNTESTADNTPAEPVRMEPNPIPPPPPAQRWLVCRRDAISPIDTTPHGIRTAFYLSLFLNNTVVLCVCATPEIAVREYDRLQHLYHVDVGGSLFHRVRVRRVAPGNGAAIQFWANADKSIDWLKAEFYIQGPVGVVEQ